MRIAVIGSGIAGLSAAWLLSQRHDVTVYEKDARVGGHANTVEARLGGRQAAVDTGFIVLNERTYPNLLALFAELGVTLRASTMSFAVSLDQGRLEYGGRDLRQVFAQKRNLASPRFMGMALDILRFFRSATALLARPQDHHLSLGDWLAREGYGRAFMEDHLLPMAAAIWSCPPSAMLAFPAASFVRFFDNHGLLQYANRPAWFTVAGGSRDYVSRIEARLARPVRTACPVTGLRRVPAGVMLREAGGDEVFYDHAVVAAHADQALRLLSDPSPAEQAVLSAFAYQDNLAVLHSDPALMPRRQAVWSSWNYLGSGDGLARRVSVTYWMNSLQGIDPALPLFVSLNPLREPAPALVHGRFRYEHPVFDAAAMAAQARLPAIQGGRRTWFCGAWCGYGFHEDGLAAGIAVARSLGCDPPWPTSVGPYRAAAGGLAAAAGA
ncbi:MAG: NAD(P)/FAD-dependent oxidoreductase [Thalassobaculales bacterium]